MKVFTFVTTFVLCSLSLLAQDTRGSIAGRVLDPSGSVIAGASVTRVEPRHGN